MSARQPLLSSKGDHSHENGVPAIRTPSPCYQSINNSDPNDPLVVSISSEPGVTSGEETRVYKRRWYILLIFSLMAGTQGGVWNTFGPISPTVKDAFGWDVGTISLLTNWGPISLIAGSGPLIWALERKGLRVACLWSAFFIASGTVVRVFTMNTPAVTYLMNLGQALNGLAGPLAMAGPPALSAVWFPPHQRTTATSIGSFFAILGTAGGFLIGPLLVPDVPDNTTSVSDDFQFSTAPYPHNESNSERITREKEAIRRLMYIECGWSCGIFVAMLIYFPKKPPLPPSPSASIQRQDFVSSLKHVLCCSQFWVLAIVYGLSQGVLSCWSSVMDVLLQPHGIAETLAGWIGFSACCGGSFLAIIIGVLADCMKRAMKWIVLVFYVAGTVCFIVFTLAANNYITPSTMLFTATVVGGTTAVYASTPLVFELVCEVVYPAGEGTANGVLNLINNVAGGVFLLIMMIPSIGTGWMNWVLVGSCGQAIPLLLLLRVNYNRLDLDEHRPHLSAIIHIPPPSPPSPIPAV